MNPPTTEPTCKTHDDAPAIAVCADCGEGICGACHDFDHRGFALCPSCRGEGLDDVPTWERPGAEYTPRSYATTLWQLIRHPRIFSTQLSPRGNWLPAVLFGFISMTIGLLFDRIWMFTLQPEVQAQLQELTAGQEIPPDQLQILVFLTTPLSVLLAGAVHIGALKTAIDIAGGSCSWSAAARIAGYAVGAYLFLLVPPVAGLPIGRLLAVIWLFNMEASALRRFFDFSPWTATLTVIVPAMVLMMCGG